MPNLTLQELKQNLTPRQRQAWRMRYQYRWRLKRIAIEMGIQCSSVCELLQRAQRSVGIDKPIRIKVIRTKPRFLPTQSLSTAQDY